MARRTDIHRVNNPSSGDRHPLSRRLMTSSEQAERDARQKKHDDMLARQQAYEQRFIGRTHQRQQPSPMGCVFAKSCKLPNGIINHDNPAGFVPVEALADFGQLCLLGGRETDAAGNIALQKISGHELPAALGTLVLGQAGVAGSATARRGTTAATAGALLGMVALLWPSNPGDSSLYTDKQLKSLKHGRTRFRLHVEQQADGTLKGYGYNTQKRRDWEIIPVVQVKAQGIQLVAEVGHGTTLIWTPAVTPGAASAIPALQRAPQTPHIWIYPPTEQADDIIVNPLHPPHYKDFILVFPTACGVRPLYGVISPPAIGSDIRHHRRPLSLPGVAEAQPVQSPTR